MRLLSQTLLLTARGRVTVSKTAACSAAAAAGNWVVVAERALLA